MDMYLGFNRLESTIYPITEPYFRPYIDGILDFPFPDHIFFEIVKGLLLFGVHFLYFIQVCILHFFDFWVCFFNYAWLMFKTLFLMRPPIPE